MSHTVLSDVDGTTVLRSIGYQQNFALMLKSQHPNYSTVPPLVYSGRLLPSQVETLEAEFSKMKTLHSTDLALLAAEMAVNEKDVQSWYHQRVAAWRREQGLSDCFGQI